MVAEKLIGEMHEKFLDNELLLELIKTYFENNSNDLKSVVDKYLEDKLNDIKKS
ncbi:MAG TPA: hypothetical protein PKH80_03070 [Methanofastidiosum sp.]|nr:hypothetical protein [Methanofastidiosum sp.]HNU61942.1 hypothetical protein [Methanofastidiosum sp.]